MSKENNNQKKICYECVRETYLSQEIRKHGKAGRCSYCGRVLNSIPIDELADRIDSAFADHYVRTSDQPDSWQERAMADPESTYEWERTGQPVLEAIEDAASISREAAADVLEILDSRHGDFDSAVMGEETEFSSETSYEVKVASAQAWQEEWRTFEQSLKTEARFFSRLAAELLARVFDHVDTLKTKPRRPLVVNAGPSHKLTHLFRARVFQSDEGLKEALCRPDLHLGSPPARCANAGRMNARGISVFYGATDAGAALAEVRPPVGSKVTVARFTIIRPLRLLDLTALDGVRDEGSIFDPTLKRRLERVAFLQTLGDRMTRPVMPDDEAFEYLATQAVADFLATENEPRLDGIIFSSAQAKTGRNVVLFQKAARIEEMQIPKGGEIEAYMGYGTEDGWKIDYTVTEDVTKASAQLSLGGDEDPFDLTPKHPAPHRSDTKTREVTLRVEVDSIEVHHIEWVKVNSTRFAVSRHRH
jgi:hypothetical protein